MRSPFRAGKPLPRHIDDNASRFRLLRSHFSFGFINAAIAMATAAPMLQMANIRSHTGYGLQLASVHSPACLPSSICCDPIGFGVGLGRGS